jgi:trimethylamine corrinoid protein|tara:strand:- start:53 stop:706 length:654 start_codon:yes stop_codon:yes gene_type:complete
MANKDELSDILRERIKAFDEDGIEAAIEEMCKEGISAVDTVAVIGETMNYLGKLFEKMEVALPELVLAGDGVKRGMVHIEKALKVTGEKIEKMGTVIHGTVQGDIHSVGKDMVEMFLMTSGFDVTDLGTDVAPRVFIEEAERLGADIICASALMSTSMPVQRDLVDFIEAKGLAEKYKIMVGGGPVTMAWAERIGADGWGKDAVEARKMAMKLLGKD